ncbi:hypothetical protein Scep_005356 [Stephania cephalantha]|uniref:Uncharacterized protein n=1 Tax=Stephania cephalantha TaxID=152367 RepID=A0AAP0PWA8_9MAGN
MATNKQTRPRDQSMEDNNPDNPEKQTDTLKRIDDVRHPVDSAPEKGPNYVDEEEEVRVVKVVGEVNVAKTAQNTQGVARIEIV